MAMAMTMAMALVVQVEEIQEEAIKINVKPLGRKHGRWAISFNFS